MTTNRYIREDGKVAVLISKGYGAGWYGWSYNEDCLFEPTIVELVLQIETLEKSNPKTKVVQQKMQAQVNKLNKKIEKIAEEKYGDCFYTGGAYQLTIVWLDPGTLFQVNEHDGAESIRLKEADDWLTA